VAPEYASRGQLSEKVDVFSFGVLVLEIVSGRKNIEPNLNEDQAYLLEWVSNFITLLFSQMESLWQMYKIQQYLRLWKHMSNL
jgi:hypothetical protein